MLYFPVLAFCDNADAATELADELAASATRPGIFDVLAYDGNHCELSVSLRHSFNNSRSFGTNSIAVRSILDVAASEDSSISCQNGGSNWKFGIR